MKIKFMYGFDIIEAEEIHRTERHVVIKRNGEVTTILVSDVITEDNIPKLIKKLNSYIYDLNITIKKLETMTKEHDEIQANESAD